MSATDLNEKQLLELDPESGIILFAGQRALVLDAVAMGLLRKYLVENFGLVAARTVLTQFGFAHGQHKAEAMQAHFKWSSDDERRRAATRVHALEGLFRAEPGSDGFLSKAGVTLASSYEAEQHLMHFGRSNEPVCWTICGLTSGYLGLIDGKEIYVLEDRCVGKGDAACHLIGKTREEWGASRAEELTFFKPDRLREALDVSLQRVTESLKGAERKLQEHRRVLVRAAPDVDEPLGIIAKSAEMRKLVDLARRVAKFDSTVLITGESGSGKERFAQLIHDESSRAAGPFIAVNCGAITETLLESELFGHTRGAFTGATRDRSGLFEEANHGTLLLDEIAEVSPGMQVKLLRALQEREIRRVGENKSRFVNVRVVAATNRDLPQRIAEGTFRQDLYYRLKVVDLHVPPLRERRDDILPLAYVLVTNAALRMKREVAGLSRRAADQLLRYPWPGNVRELENALERAIILSLGGQIELEDLPEEVRKAVHTEPRPGAVRTLEEMEREHILSVLALNGGNQTHAAAQLDIGAATLYRKLKRYGLIEPERRARRKSARA